MLLFQAVVSRTARGGTRGVPQSFLVAYLVWNF